MEVLLRKIKNQKKIKTKLKKNDLQVILLLKTPRVRADLNHRNHKLLQVIKQEPKRNTTKRIVFQTIKTLTRNRINKLTPKILPKKALLIKTKLNTQEINQVHLLIIDKQDHHKKINQLVNHLDQLIKINKQIVIHPLIKAQKQENNQWIHKTKPQTQETILNQTQLTNPKKMEQEVVQQQTKTQWK